MGHPPAWLQGLFAVMPTPMKGGGELDLESLDRLVDHYLDGGCAGLVPASIAGEGDLLDAAERTQVISRVVERARGRAPVIVGILDDDLATALASARVAADCGAGALLVKPPTGGDAAVLAHLDGIARALHLPIVLLDNPKFGGTLSPALVAELARAIPEVCAIKLEEEPTAAKMRAVRALAGPGVRIFGGLGGIHCLSELESGADGFFTGFPQPEYLLAVMDCMRRGAPDAAAAAYRHLLPQAERERANAAAMIVQRKLFLRDAGVLREAVSRTGAGATAHRDAQGSAAPGKD
jgi:4-hydroxy-tetrahydrodipicolinate synthase